MCSLPSKLLVDFLAFLQGLDLSIYLPISPFFVITGVWEEGPGGVVLELSAGDVGIGDPLLTSDIGVFFQQDAVWHPCSELCFGLVKDYALTKLASVNLCFGGLSLLLQSSCVGGSYGYRFALRRALLWKQVCVRLPRGVVP